ncbi:hypothetical protein IW261DRAFT_1598517 [Armillaria novae-zelandiae]|uniref:Dystroglycan-type cadherin-like domain-containing protein n=1 Tax=Armillaria novae-zelandiae TaxID=153914 RepID=A0AA39TT93_9AGAR|nr:hypothetical protein IW261DRAFT_1598517 [Armillaria novae-zelandiae]
MLDLILLLFLHFPSPLGFRFDNFTGTVTMWTPIILSWHRDESDTAQINFTTTYAVTPQIQTIDWPSVSTDTNQPDGTLNATFTRPGPWIVRAIGPNSSIMATSQTFSVDVPGNSGSWSLLSRPSDSVNISGSVETQILSNHSSTSSVLSTLTAPPSSNSIHRNDKTSIIIGAVIGSLVSLLIIIGGATFFLIRRRRRHRDRNMKNRLSPNLKVMPNLPPHSPPVRNKIGEVITPTLAGGVAPVLENRLQETVEHSLTEDEGERRNAVGMPLHVADSVSQDTQQQQADLDVVAEVLRLRTQVQQIIVERDEERFHGNPPDLPPAYS